METTVLTEKQIAEFGEHLRSDEKSPHTIGKYLRDARAFCSFANGRALEKGLVIAYKEHLTQSGDYADGSVNSMLSSLRALFGFLCREDCRVKGIRTQGEPFSPEGRTLTEGECKRLIRAAGDGTRTQLVVKALAATGVRVSELRHFTVEAVAGAKNGAGVRVFGKRKGRVVLVPEGLRQELLRHARERGIRQGPIFQTRGGKPLDRSNVWRQLKRLCKAAGVAEGKAFPHNLRKLFARKFYGASRDIAQLASLLGHSSVDTTRIYVRTTAREARRWVERMAADMLWDGPRPRGRESMARGSDVMECGRDGKERRHDATGRGSGVTEHGSSGTEHGRESKARGSGVTEHRTNGTVHERGVTKRGERKSPPKGGKKKTTLSA